LVVSDIYWIMFTLLRGLLMSVIGCAFNLSSYT